MRRISEFFKNNKYLLIMVLILILANLLRILFYASELGILGFIATFLFLIVLIPITIVISFKIFKKSKFSAILAPIIAFITLITFMTFPLQSLYIRVNHIMYKDLRCDFIIDYEKGKIDLIRKGAYLEFPEDLPPKYRNISNRRYIVQYENEYRFVLSDGLMGEYTAIMYAPSYTDEDIQELKELDDFWYYVVSY